MQEWIDAFLQHLKSERQLSPHTLKKLPAAFSAIYGITG